MNYKQAYDKIIDAYFKDEIKPCNLKFCFCGTLNGGAGWNAFDEQHEYTLKEYGRMEKALFSSMPDAIYKQIGYVVSKGRPGSLLGVSYTEDELFAGMSAALDVLKQIHIERGEVIDQPQPFTKRELKTTTQC